MYPTTIQYTSIEFIWSKHFDENLMHSDSELIYDSIIFKDGINDLSENIYKLDYNYQYQIAFKGLKPVGCISIYNNGSQCYLHRNISILCKFELIK